MSNKNKFLAMGAFYLLIGVLLFYAASRTLHFVQGVMANSTWGYLFLFATGVGAVIWLYVYLTYAQGAKQRGISFVMGLLDLIGELALVYADTIYVGDQAGLVKMTSDEMQLFIVVSVVMVGVNIFAGYLFKLWDLKAEQDQQAQDLVDHVTDATMKHLNTPEVKAQMVNELLPVLKDSISLRVQEEIFSRASGGRGLDARSMGWPVDEKPIEKKEQEVSFLSSLAQRLGLAKKDQVPQMNHQVAWIVRQDGKRHRIFCMICQREGKPWFTDEPCEHVLNADPEPATIEMLATGLRDAFKGSEEKSS